MKEQPRRRFVGTAATALVASAAAGTLAGCEPEKPATAATFVLVHGSASNSMFWSPLVQQLALRGHRCLPVDLPGHGFAAAMSPAYQAPQDLARFAAAPSAVAGATLQGYARHVVDLVRRVRGHGPVILVGHSLGGSTLGTVANAIPDDISHLVYVSAFCCVRARNPLELLTSPEARVGAAPTPTASPMVAGAPAGVSRYNWRTAQRAALDGYRDSAAGDLSDEQLTTVLNYAQQPDEAIEPSLADARVHAETWGRIPRTYVMLSKDRLVTPALARKMITEADNLTPRNKFRQRSIPTSHLGVVYKADQLAAILDELAGGR